MYHITAIQRPFVISVAFCISLGRVGTFSSSNLFSYNGLLIFFLMDIHLFG